MEFKQGISVNTDDFWYDLFDGGYLKPETVLENQEDINKINEAIITLKKFKKEMEDKEILTYF